MENINDLLEDRTKRTLKKNGREQSWGSFGLFDGMGADLVECFLTQDMLDLAGVLLCNIGRHAELDQIAREQDVTLVDLVCDRLSLCGQLDTAVLLYGDISVFPQAFHSSRNTGF